MPLHSSAQSEFKIEQQTLTNPDNEPVPVHPIPHERQMKWNETEFYAFFHYGMNTYTGLEWGNGDEPESRGPQQRRPYPSRRRKGQGKHMTVDARASATTPGL